MFQVQVFYHTIFGIVDRLLHNDAFFVKKFSFVMNIKFSFIKKKVSGLKTL